MEFRSGGLLFTSKFDSGNLARVERVLHDEDEDPGVHRIGDPCITPDFEFNVWTNPDCAGTEFENGNRTWFHFAIKGCPMNKLVKINVMNLNKQGKLYSQGMSPVVKVIPQKPKWERIRDRPTHETVNGQFTVSFTYRFEYRFSAVFFAFCYPFSYSEYQVKLEELDAKFQNSRNLSPSSPVNSIYYHREVLCYSRDHLRVDLVTLSSCHGITDKEESRLDRLFPDTETPRAKKFRRKRVFFLTSRVHPGETPASFVFNGFLDFILRPKDPRAIQLRKQYVFKLVPLLNPDGVQRGHYRTDQRGVNLNRMYLNPDPDLHPSIFAAKSLILHHHIHSRVKSQLASDKGTEPDKGQRPLTSQSERQTVQRQSVHSAHSRIGQQDASRQQDLVVSNEDDVALDQDNVVENDLRKPTAIVMVHNSSEKPCNKDIPLCDETVGTSQMDVDCAAGGDVVVPSGDASLHCNQSNVNGTGMHSLGGLPDGYQMSHPLSSLTRDASLEESDGEDGDLCQKTSSLTLADTTATPKTPCFNSEDLLSIPSHESGIAFYVDLHGHASKRGCFIYGNHLTLVEDQVENMLYPKLISMNSAYFDFDGCNFTEKNMYTKDKRDGMSKEGSGRVAIHKATGIIHSYTLECNYNTGRFMNSMAPATMDDGRATPPPVAGFPPKYTMAHYEEVGRAVAVAALDMTDTNPWSRIASTDYLSVHGVRGWVQRYLRSMRGAPKLPNKMSRVASKTSSIVASATSHTGMHTRARQALSDTSAHQAAASQSAHSTASNHGNNNSNRKSTTSRHLGPVRETRTTLERKKRLAQMQSSHLNQSTTFTNPSPCSSYTVNTPAPCSTSAHSPVNLTFSSGANQSKPLSHGVGQSKPQTLSLTHKNVGSHVNNSNIRHGATAGKATNSKIQPATHRMPPKGGKKVVEELLNHMVVNTLDGLKKTSNKDAETARLQGETRPLGQPAGEARFLGGPPKSPVGQRLFQQANKKKVGGAKGDEVSKPEKASLVSPKRRRRKAASTRRSSSHSPSRKGSQHRKNSETDSEGDFKNVLVRTRASTIASSYSDPSSTARDQRDLNSTSAVKHLHPQTEKIQMSSRRRSTGGSTPEATYLRPHMDHMTLPQSVTARSLSPSATISCQLLDLNAIHPVKPIKNTNYWTEN